MGLFGFGKKNDSGSTSGPVTSVALGNAPAAAPAAGGIDLGKKSGKIDLSKGSRVTIEKTPVIKATAAWSSNTDYDLYALVLLKDGRELVVSTFGSQTQPNPTPSVLNGAVRHLGDIGRGVKGQAQETIEIKMTDEIAAIVPIAYSAQSNGTGSFRRYNVSLGMDNGAGTEVQIGAGQTSSNDTVYTVAIGIIRNSPEGITIENLEAYSKAGSELRPTFKNGQLFMDAGARNLYK